MNKLAIMQPYIFPYLGYFQLIKSVDTFILYDNIQYLKKGWVNRNRLVELNKSPFYFTIPLGKISSNKKIKDLKISSSSWKRNLENLIFYNYKRCIYFDETYSTLEKIFSTEIEYISELNAISIIAIANHIKTETRILHGIDFDWLEIELQSYDAHSSKNILNDKSGIVTKKIRRIIDICGAYQSSTYINPINGRALYPKDIFRQFGIDIHFLKMNDFQYPQQTSQFYSNLSIIDVLMNCGRELTQEYLTKYTLY